MLGIKMVFLSHFTYEKKQMCIGKDKLRTVQERFNNNLNYDYERKDSSSSELIHYYDIKERSFKKGNIIITPSIFFEFSKKDSVLQKVTFAFVSDNIVQQEELSGVLKLLAKNLPILEEYIKSNKMAYKINDLQIMIRNLAPQDFEIEVVVQSMVFH